MAWAVNDPLSNEVTDAGRHRKCHHFFHRALMMIRHCSVSGVRREKTGTTANMGKNRQKASRQGVNRGRPVPHVLLMNERHCIWTEDSPGWPGVGEQPPASAWPWATLATDADRINPLRPRSSRQRPHTRLYTVYIHSHWRLSTVLTFGTFKRRLEAYLHQFIYRNFQFQLYNNLFSFCIFSDCT